MNIHPLQGNRRMLTALAILWQSTFLQVTFRLWSNLPHRAQTLFSMLYNETKCCPSLAIRLTEKPWKNRSNVLPRFLLRKLHLFASPPRLPRPSNSDPALVTPPLVLLKLSTSTLF